ncbi:Uncharacterised protein [Bordetella pertussis]|nr:Uncharacterised protein [Bordetella pertussis]
MTAKTVSVPAGGLAPANSRGACPDGETGTRKLSGVPVPAGTGTDPPPDKQTAARGGRSSWGHAGAQCAGLAPHWTYSAPRASRNSGGRWNRRAPSRQPCTVANSARAAFSGVLA